MTNRDRYPHLSDTMIAQMDDYDRRVKNNEIPWHSDSDYDHGHMTGQTHPEVWFTGNALSVFLDRGAVAVAGTVKRPAWLDDTSHYGTALPQYKQRPDTYPNGR